MKTKKAIRVQGLSNVAYIAQGTCFHVNSEVFWGASPHDLSTGQRQAVARTIHISSHTVYRQLFRYAICTGLYGALQNGPSSTFKLEAELNASDLEIWQANYSTSYATQDIDQ